MPQKLSQCKNDQSFEILNSLYSNQQAWVKGNTIEESIKILKNLLNRRL